MSCSLNDLPERGTQKRKLNTACATLSRKLGGGLLALVCPAAPNGNNVFLALFSYQVGNYKHIMLYSQILAKITDGRTTKQP